MNRRSLLRLVPIASLAAAFGFRLPAVAKPTSDVGSMGWKVTYADEVSSSPLDTHLAEAAAVTDGRINLLSRPPLIVQDGFVQTYTNVFELSNSSFFWLVGGTSPNTVTITTVGGALT